MGDFFRFDRGQEQETPINLEDLDISAWNRGVKWVFVGLVVLLVLAALNWARSFYTDWLWYSQLGYQAVLWKVITTQAWLFLLGAAVFLLVAVPNLFLVLRDLQKGWRLGGTGLPPQLERAVKQLMSLIAMGGLLVLSWMFASTLAGQWELVLRFLSGVPFDQNDPIFGRDLGFYVFTLPALEFFRGWLLGMFLVVALLVLGLYYLQARLQGRMLSFSGRLRTHLAGLGAVIFVLLAAGHWLGRYDLLYATTGAVVGIGFTDANVKLPALALMTGVAFVSALLLVGSIFSGGARLVYWAVGLWLGTNLVGVGILPPLVQRLYVEPSELVRERPYLAHQIEHTRRGYALDRITSRSHPALGILDHETVDGNQGTIQNVRLWDEGPLLQSYNQIQFFRLYYDFLAVSTDRYDVNGQLRQVMLSTRELSAEKLPQEAQRWTNRHLQYTHGYGVAMSQVTEVDAAGRPTFLIQDIPPHGEIPLERPEVYYGLKSLDFLIVRTKMEEFNYPGPDGQPVYTHYEGEGGVPLNSLFRSLLYALQFRDINILISDQIEPDSRIQYRRTVGQRFSTLTPFLLRDRNPYVVAADGRLFWIQDAYTATDRFPYSTRWRGQFNYMRNSVKTVIDAYHGKVDYYVTDPEDPLIQTYQQIFPSLFKSFDEMPGFLRPHIRYPQDFFTVQVQMLLQYHMQDPTVFYNREDQWAMPLQTSFGRSATLEPYYIVARLPDSDREEFLLIQPFTPVARHNLVAWLAARSDPPHYGELTLFRFPAGRHVDGPNQVEARIDNDPIISEQFTLWGQVGSEVSRGILLVIPIGDAILYAEPVFLRPEILEFPELRRIILADSTKVVMQPTLDHAVRAVVGELPAVAPLMATADAEVEFPSDVEPPRPLLTPIPELETVTREVEEALRRLQDVLDRLHRMASPASEDRP